MTYPPGPANPGTPQYDPTHQQPGFYLTQLPPPQPQRGLSRKTVLILVFGLLVPLIAAGVATMAWADRRDADRGTPAAVTTPDTDGMGQPDGAPPPTRGPSDPNGQKACDAVRAANEGGGNFDVDPAAALAIATDGMKASKLRVGEAAGKLAYAAEVAGKAKGTDTEQTERIKLATAMLNLETECILAGYYPPPR